MPRSKVIKYFNDNADKLSAQYNSLDRAQVHADLIALLPPSRKLEMLDIGAGSGADAAFFASLGHHVVAAEPAKKLRDIANKTFKNNKIEWNNDRLPTLKSITSSGKKFDVIYAMGTFQYLNKKDRATALKKIATLLNDGGLVEIQYPTPPSREYQFLVGAGEITDFVKRFNATAKNGALLEIVHQKNTKDFAGRKALDGSDLYFNATILRRRQAPPQLHG